MAFAVAGSSPIVANCGTEIAQSVTTSGSTSSFPTITFPQAVATKLYTIVFVDQDAGAIGPIGHSVVANVPGSVLASTVGLTATNVQTYFLEPFNGPGVSAGMGCHHYVVILYEQTPGMTPYINMATAYNYLGKLYLLNFNFPVFASQYDLTRVASQMWQTQNDADRKANGPCNAVPQAPGGAAIWFAPGSGCPSGATNPPFPGYIQTIPTGVCLSAYPGSPLMFKAICVGTTATMNVFQGSCSGVPSRTSLPMSGSGSSCGMQ